MNTGNTIHDELNELNSSLNPNSSGTPFAVPEGYFDGLASSVLAKIKGEADVSASEEIAQLSPLLASISRNLPFSVPDNFFQSNLEGLKAFTSENEESLVLSFVDKEMPYEVPAGYFANITEQVLEKVAGQEVKVVPIMRRKWMQLAVAAVVTGIVAVSGIVYFNGKGSGGAGSDPVAKVLKKTSTQELNEFIKSTVVDVNDNTAPTTAQNSPSKKETKLFDNVSDKELEAFLNQVPTDDDEIDIN